MSSLKHNICMPVLGGGCRLKAYVHTQGDRGSKIIKPSILTLRMTPLLELFYFGEHEFLESVFRTYSYAKFFE